METNWTGKIFAHLKYIKHRLANSPRYKLTKAVMDCLETGGLDLPSEDKSSIKQFLSNRFLITQISYPFVVKYLHRKVKVFPDKNNGLYYVYHNNHKLYFKRGLKKDAVVEQYNNLCMEQDKQSPHSYKVFNIDYHPADIAIDAGAAEGIWSLDIIEKVRALYLFECEEGWIEALEATFAPWKDKIRIVKKIVSNISDKESIRLDDYFLGQGVSPTILKADIEGNEINLTEGASELLSKHLRHVILCAYHNENDYRDLSSILKQHKFKLRTSKGYMILIYTSTGYYNGDVRPIVRKGLVYGYK